MINMFQPMKRGGGAIRLFSQGRCARMGLEGCLRRHTEIHGDPVYRFDTGNFFPKIALRLAEYLCANQIRLIGDRY